MDAIIEWIECNPEIVGAILAALLAPLGYRAVKKSNTKRKAKGQAKSGKPRPGLEEKPPAK